MIEWSEDTPIEMKEKILLKLREKPEVLMELKYLSQLYGTAYLLMLKDGSFEYLYTDSNGNLKSEVVE